MKKIILSILAVTTMASSSWAAGYQCSNAIDKLREVSVRKGEVQGIKDILPEVIAIMQKLNAPYDSIQKIELLLVEQKANFGTITMAEGLATASTKALCD